MRGCHSSVRHCRVCGQRTTTPDPILDRRRTAFAVVTIGLRDDMIPEDLCLACYIDCTCPWCQVKCENDPPLTPQRQEAFAEWTGYYASTEPEPCVLCGGTNLAARKQHR
jgi:hypothetical protein